MIDIIDLHTKPNNESSIFPFPEIIYPGNWVKNATSDYKGNINVDERVLNVPVEQDNVGRFVRIHEMGHALYSPPVGRSSKKISPLVDKCLRLIEDERINLIMSNIYGKQLSNLLSNKVKPFDDYILSYSPPPDGIQPGLDRAYWFLLKRVYDSFREHLYISDEAVEKLNRLAFISVDHLTHGRACELDKLLQTFFSYGCVRNKHIKFYELRKFAAKIAEFFDDSDDSDEESKLKTIGRTGEEQLGKGDWQTKCDFVNLATVDVPPPLNKQRVATDCGTTIRYMHKYLVDRHIFALKTKKPCIGAPVHLMIDCSGSMSIKAGDIDKLVKLAEQRVMTVRIYAGAGSRGTVATIVESTGGRVKRIPKALLDQRVALLGTGNIVDVQALTLLAQQSGKKFWVCDGKVTGNNDNYYKEVDDICSKLVLKNNITRIDSLPKAIQFFERG